MKDIERIESIRNSINKYKISIAGIKTILAMVPCWKLVGCGENEDNCKAYKESTKPCWKIKHRKNYCAKRDCKECDIYNNFGDATAVKQELVKLFV